MPVALNEEHHRRLVAVFNDGRLKIGQAFHPLFVDLTDNISGSHAQLVQKANPMPWACAQIAVLMPINAALIFSKGPPLFPGLMEASV